ncbi:receptor-like protein kinase [Gossypium australe]|uniref:Receptor-like protein kinase n=1 Tax=Gossypium australe TaxID=47621 RepID=A0A5B6VWM1_9ROSI|nr:receptor-like protein kinase [Gossypium australe]
MLRQYQSDPSHIISLAKIEILPDMTYNEESIRTLAREHGVEEATWKPEEAMRKLYTKLFSGKIFGNENS